MIGEDETYLDRAEFKSVGRKTNEGPDWKTNNRDMFRDYCGLYFNGYIYVL